MPLQTIISHKSTSSLIPFQSNQTSKISVRSALLAIVISLMVLTGCQSAASDNSISVCRDVLGKNKISDWTDVLASLDSSTLPVAHDYAFSDTSSEVMDIIKCSVTKETNRLVVTFSLGESLIGKNEIDVESRLKALAELGITGFKTSYVDVESTYEGVVLDLINVETSHAFKVFLIGR